LATNLHIVVINNLHMKIRKPKQQQNNKDNNKVKSG